MRMHLLCGLAAAMLMTSFSMEADARPFRPGLLPNGSENSCSNCHVSPAGGGARTSFGEDVRANVTLGGREFFWPDVCELDSDSDGQTNGEELGDPCCVWDGSDGSFLRMADISLPGDDTSTSADPLGPDEDGDGVSNGCDPDYVPPVEDMGMSDMGVGGSDMGVDEADMGAQNNATNNDPGNNQTGDMGMSAGADMGADAGEGDDGCGCSSAPTSTATPWLLALVFAGSRVRRRR